MFKCFFFRNKNGDKSNRRPPRSSPCNGQDEEAPNPRTVADSIEVEPASSSPNLINVPYQKPSNLRVFTFAELKIATRDFSRRLRLGEGGCGFVYKGFLNNPEDPEAKTEVAVKRLTKKGLQGRKEWIAEVQFLGLVEHPNLVKLVGYCAEDGDRGIQLLLVYEFMPNKSLEHHLFSSELPVLPWAVRLKIALGAAHGLANLHEELDIQIIFRDLKSSNILLDEDFNPKLSDFGMARLGPSVGFTHVSTADLCPKSNLFHNIIIKADRWVTTCKRLLENGDIVSVHD